MHFTFATNLRVQRTACRWSWLGCGHTAQEAFLKSIMQSDDEAFCFCLVRNNMKCTVCIYMYVVFCFLFFSKVSQTPVSSSHNIMLSHRWQSYSVMQQAVFFLIYSISLMFDQISCWVFALCCVCMCVLQVPSRGKRRSEGKTRRLTEI